MNRHRTGLLLALVVLQAVPPGLAWGADSLADPLVIEEVVIVHPAEGAQVSPEEPVLPRGLVGVGGNGLLVGAWELDGVPFARFTRLARGGFPVALDCPAPVPVVGGGPHRLVLRIESPQEVASSPVTLLVLPDAPAASREWREEPGLRWSPQPGAVEYEVIISDAPRATPEARRFRTTETGLPFSSGAEGWWTVVPWYPGNIPGTPREWRPLTGDRSPPRGKLIPSLSGRWAAGTAPGEADQWRLGLAGQVEHKDGPWSWQGSGNLSLLYQVSRPRLARQESWNFLLAGTYAAESLRLHGRAGNFGSAALSGSAFLAPGLPARGLELGLQTGPWRFTAYANDPEDLDGIFSSARSARLRVRAAGIFLALPHGRGGIGLAASRAFDPGVAAAAIAAGEGRAAALYGTLNLGGTWKAAWETARTRSRVGDADTREGQAWRAELSGAAGVNRWTVRFRETDAAFRNPLNTGLLEATVPRRRTFGMDWKWSAGNTAWRLLLDRAESGARARQLGLEIGAEKPCGTRGAFQAAATLSRAARPGTSQTLAGLSAGWEGKAPWGSWSHLWRFEHQRGEAETIAASFTAAGTHGPGFTWSTHADFASLDRALGPSLRKATLSLRPAWRIPASPLKWSSHLAASWGTADLWSWDLALLWQRPIPRAPSSSLELAGGRTYPSGQNRCLLTLNILL